MVSQGIVDPILYGNYLKKTSETQAKALADPDSDESWALRNQQEADKFKEELKSQVSQSYLTGDRRQKDVLTKATEELMKDYQWTHDNVMTTYREYKDEGLMNEWNTLKPEYEKLIKESAKKFGEKITQGKSYQDAYAELISE